MKRDIEKPFNKLPFIPPKRDLIETYAILRQESRSAVALAELKGYAKTLPNQSILINAIVLKEAKASSEIENIITTHDSLYKAMTASSVKPDQATKEVLLYREALLHGFQFIGEKEYLNINGIVQIQAILEGNTAGIRKLPGTALKNQQTDQIIYTPPDDPDVINGLLKNFEEYLNNDSMDELSDLIKLAVQHYQFESIHPFYDGNGRTGRIINVLHLILKKKLEVPILFLSGFIIKNKSEYYRLLQGVRSDNNWEAWILYMLKGIEETSVETIETINRINTAFYHDIELIKKEAPSIYTKELVELLYENPYSKIEFLDRKGIAKRKAAGKYLQILRELGLLDMVTVGKENVFVNKELFRILSA